MSNLINLYFILFLCIYTDKLFSKIFKTSEKCYNNLQSFTDACLWVIVVGGNRCTNVSQICIFLYYNQFEIKNIDFVEHVKTNFE